MAFGALGVIAVIRFAVRGWIDELYIAPEHNFTYSGFWWVLTPRCPSAVPAARPRA
ncbi:MAG: hypothetical protein F4045_02835 [Chloroflexi bacterium]|nr:hypothetical protein [Chloroflexota bacterium]MYK34060.1 hypothetical protein [Chloroflexota bacterium]